MKNDWLWDKNIGIVKAAGILKDERDPRFVSLSATLLSRKNSAKEVFSGYIEPLTFYRNWAKIKKAMRKDNWAHPRIEYWQAIFEKLQERYSGQGIVLRKQKKEINETCKAVGDCIRKERASKGISQRQLAKKIGISQQMLSRIEKGRENLSVSTIKKIADKLGRKIRVNIE